MQTYTNKFNIIVNGSKTEVILNFSQCLPTVRNCSEIKVPPESTGEDTPIANLVMTGQLAHELATVILSLLEPQEQ